jgi:hypothetical protein
MQQVAQESGAVEGISWCAVVITFKTWSREEVSVVQLSCWKDVSPLTKFTAVWWEVDGDDIVRWQHVRKWCTEFENTRTDVHCDDRTGRRRTWKTDVKRSARVDVAIPVTLRDLSVSFELSVGLVHWMHEPDVCRVGTVGLVLTWGRCVNVHRGYAEK